MVDLKQLERQAKEAEALVRQLERGEKATPKQSHSYTLKNSHGGYAGKSLIEKIRDDLRETIGEYESLLSNDENVEYLDGLLDGMCHALAILRGNDGATERDWAESEWRVTQKKAASAASTADVVVGGSDSL